MDVYEHFACYTKLPISLDDVCEQVIEYGAVQKFQFAEVDIGRNSLQGMSRMLRKTGLNGEIVAQISYSSEIKDYSTARIVCCKEVIHTLDSDAVSARSRNAVGTLIENIVVPLQVLALTKSTLSDHAGMLLALMVLLPRDALSVIRPKYESGQLSAEQVARLAVIPDAYARLALSSSWAEVIESIK